MLPLSFCMAEIDLLNCITHAMEMDFKVILFCAKTWLHDKICVNVKF